MPGYLVPDQQTRTCRSERLNHNRYQLLFFALSRETAYVVAPPEGLEPPTSCSEGMRSIPLNYGGMGERCWN